MVIIVVLIELLAAGAIIGLENRDSEEASTEIHKELSLIARVNTEGSGIYISSEYNADDFLTVSKSGEVKYNADYWGGKVFGTPGASTIQHVQLMGIVEDELGLTFEKYNPSGSKSKDKVYFVDSVANYDAAINSADILDGGILWEPQYHKILSSSLYKGLVTTNVLFPGHTCCLIAGYQDYLNKNPDETARFLAAYIEAVNYINAAKADHSSEKYATLVEICMENIPGLTEDVVKEALDGVTYTYSDKAESSDLDALVGDIASLTENLTNLQAIKVQMSELGFDSYTEFAKAFIDNKYLSHALTYGPWEGEEKRNIAVAAIEGDVHQIAIQVAISLGYFEDYGLNVGIRALKNGGAVALDLLSGQSDLAFMGAPPITSATVNGKKIYVTEKEPVVKKDLSLISKVNTDGSGIYLASKYNSDDFVTVSPEGEVTYKTETWGGKVFGTPGASSIQHVQLMTIVQDKLKLKFEKYMDGGSLSSDTVYFVDTITNYTHAINNAKILDGGIIWEPQYHYILSNEHYDGMVTTNSLFPGHTCCVIAGYEGYIEKHPDETARFLASYIKAVNYINLAKQNQKGEEFKNLIDICNKHIEGLTPEIIEQAILGVVYTYSDTEGTADLTKLKSDIASLAEELTVLDVIKKKITDLGFESYAKFSDAFIDNSYLDKALKVNEYNGNDVAKIKVGIIKDDVHRIAIIVAQELGYFEGFGIEVTINEFPNGGLVSQDLLSGQSDFAFMGAPPITSASINGDHIRMVEA